MDPLLRCVSGQLGRVLTPPTWGFGGSFTISPVIFHWGKWGGYRVGGYSFPPTWDPEHSSTSPNPPPPDPAHIVLPNTRPNIVSHYTSRHRGSTGRSHSGEKIRKPRSHSRPL